MTIELSKEDRAQAIASIERYFRENMEEKIGNVAAGGLLGFFIDEIIFGGLVADGVGKGGNDAFVLRLNP